MFWVVIHGDRAGQRCAPGVRECARAVRGRDDPQGPREAAHGVGGGELLERVACRGVVEVDAAAQQPAAAAGALALIAGIAGGRTISSSASATTAVLPLSTGLR